MDGTRKESYLVRKPILGKIHVKCTLSMKTPSFKPSDVSICPKVNAESMKERRDCVQDRCVDDQ